MAKDLGSHGEAFLGPLGGKTPKTGKGNAGYNKREVTSSDSNGDPPKEERRPRRMRLFNRGKRLQRALGDPMKRGADKGKVESALQAFSSLLADSTSEELSVLTQDNLEPEKEGGGSPTPDGSEVHDMLPSEEVV